MADGVRHVEDIVADGGYLQGSAIIDGADVDDELSETSSGVLREMWDLGAPGDVRPSGAWGRCEHDCLHTLRQDRVRPDRQRSLRTGATVTR